MSISKSLTVALAWTAYALAGCGDSGGSGGAGASGNPGGQGGQAGTAGMTVDSGPPPPTGLTPRDFSAMNVATFACNYVTAGQPDVLCQGVEQYTSCEIAACPVEDLAACYGAGYAQNDTTGGACDAFIDCVLGSPDHCTHECMPDTACNDCVATRLSSCLLSALCQPPTCD